MLDDLDALRTFRAILQHGSLSAAGRALGVSLAVVSKRLATLERRVGLRLVNRTTRSLSPTEEGTRLLPAVERALDALREAEDQLGHGRDEPIGTLRISAPVSFGRRHVAPVLGALVQRHPTLDGVLSLDDRVVDVLGGEFDVAIRIGTPAVSGAVVRKLADNRRLLVAAPDYLDREGRPALPGDLAAHTLLRYGDGVAPWLLHGPGGRRESLPARPRLRVDSGDALQDWCLAGLGIMRKSLVDVRAELADGRLERVLPDWHCGSRPINAVFAGRHHQPRKLRVFLEAMQRAMLER